MTFDPLPGLYGEQTLIYQVTDADGNTTTANAVVDVVCAECNDTPNITLRWTPIAGDLDGYRVFFGGTPTTADNPVSDVTTNSATFNAGADLGLRLGDDQCFRVKAYNQRGDPTSPAQFAKPYRRRARQVASNGNRLRIIPLVAAVRRMMPARTLTPTPQRDPSDTDKFDSGHCLGRNLQLHPRQIVTNKYLPQLPSCDGCLH